MLFDQFGREIKMGEIKSPETREISVQLIRDRWSTYPSSGLTPERLAAILRAADQGDMLRQAELFEEMEEKDAHLASQFQIRKLAVQGLSWEVLPATDDAPGAKAAELCTAAISGLSDFDDHVLDMLDALPKGYSMLEVMWDVSSGQAMVRDLRWIHPKKVTFWDSIHPRILTEEEPIRGVDPAPFKFLYHRYKARSGYDTRAGILRVCAWMYLFKNYGIKDWAAFAEIYGMPLRLGKYEPGASKSDKEALLNAIRSLGSDAAGIISKSTEIEFVESQKSSGTGQNIYESLVRFCDAQMSKAILGQTLTSEAGGEKGQGSLALGRVHGDVRQDLVEADCRALAKTLSQQLLRPLVGFNFGWNFPIPRFRFLYEPPEDLKSAAEMYKILRGDLNQPISREHISARFKVPLPKEGETVSTGQEEPLPESPDVAKLKASRALKAKDLPGDPGQDFIDALVLRLQDEKLMDPVLEQVIAKVQSAGSYEEILEHLYAQYAEMDSSRFQETMNRATFAAELWGYLTSREENR